MIFEEFPEGSIDSEAQKEQKESQVIGPTTASTYRKELTEGKTWANQGKDKPKVLKGLIEEQIAMSERKLAAFDAKTKASGKRMCTGKWGNT